jgi:hypothetical protein
MRKYSNWDVETYRKKLEKYLPFDAYRKSSTLCFFGSTYTDAFVTES